MKRLKKVLLFIFLPLILTIVVYLSIDTYKQYISYRFEEVTEKQFFKSGTVPTDKIEQYVNKYDIKTIIDLRHGQIHDKLNSATEDMIVSERDIVLNIKDVNYHNIASNQIPTEDNLQKYFEILQDSENYPIWVHCADGIGRANLYTALYKIEVLGYDSDKARKETRWPLIFSNFDRGTKKGEYLINYKKKNIAQIDKL